LFIGTGVFVALVLSVWLWRVKSQPAYKGQSLDYWVQKAPTGDQSPETQKAILALGPEAIRKLLEAMTQADSKLRDRWVEMYRKVPKVFQQLVRHQPRSVAEARFSAYSS
jgi:hypothetical protein